MITILLAIALTAFAACLPFCIKELGIIIVNMKRLNIQELEQRTKYERMLLDSPYVQARRRSEQDVLRVGGSQ